MEPRVDGKVAGGMEQEEPQEHWAAAEVRRQAAGLWQCLALGEGRT